MPEVTSQAVDTCYKLQEFFRTANEPDLERMANDTALEMKKKEREIAELKRKLTGYEARGKEYKEAAKRHYDFLTSIAKQAMSLLSKVKEVGLDLENIEGAQSVNITIPLTGFQLSHLIKVYEDVTADEMEARLRSAGKTETNETAAAAREEVEKQKSKAEFLKRLLENQTQSPQVPTGNPFLDRSIWGRDEASKALGGLYKAGNLKMHQPSFESSGVVVQAGGDSAVGKIGDYLSLALSTSIKD